MTTPYQAAPDGAYVVGGGEWNYGQTLDEKLARQAFEFPMPNIGNMLDLLRVALERLPLEALQPFADFIGFVGGVFSNVVEAANEIINALIVRPIMQTVAAFEDWVSDFFSTFSSGLVSGNLTDFGNWFQDNVTDPIVGTVDGFIRGVAGLLGNGFNFNVVEETAKNLADAIASMNSIVTQLNQKAANGTFTGNAVVVDFSQETAGSTLGGAWSQTHTGSGTGTLGIASGRAKWLGTATDRTGLAVYTAKETVSDYQKVGAAFATLPSTNFFGGNRSYNYLYGRVNAAGDSYVYLKLGQNEAEIGCVVSGSPTFFDSIPGFKFKPGVAYWLECGTNGTPTGGNSRIFRVWENNRIIRTYTEGGAVSQISAAHRKVGMGVTASSNTYLPAEVSSFAFFDNFTPDKVGSGWRRMRTDTANVNQSSGVNMIPSNFFDTADVSTEGYTWVDGASNNNNRVTVSTPGWYLINIKIRHNGDLNNGAHEAQVVLYVNGTVTQSGVEQWGPGTIGAQGGKDMGGVFVQYLNAGDYINPGISTSLNPLPLTGGPAGVQTYFSVVFLNNVRPT